LHRIKLNIRWILIDFLPSTILFQLPSSICLNPRFPNYTLFQFFFTFVIQKKGKVYKIFIQVKHYFVYTSYFFSLRNMSNLNRFRFIKGTYFRLSKDIMHELITFHFYTFENLTSIEDIWWMLENMSLQSTLLFTFFSDETRIWKKICIQWLNDQFYAIKKV
jgi:hypothetical protein